MSLTVKAYLHKEWISEPIETRRFALDQDVATNYTYLTEKLARVFPQVEAQNIIISYLDPDGDRVTVSSDEELTDALDQFDGTIFRLHLKEKKTENESLQHNPPFIPPFFPRQFCHPHRFTQGWNPGVQQTTGDNPARAEKQEEKKPEKDEENPQPKEAEEQKGPHHPGIVCDGCNGSIYGRRFKCTTCPDYDLCGSCEGKGIHTDHNMYTIDEPRPACGGRQRQQQQWGRGGLGYGGPFNFGFGPFGGTFELWGHPGGFNPFHPSGPFSWFGNQCSDPSQNTTKEEAMDTEKPADVPNPAHTEVLEQLKAMGFEDEGGWLHELVKAKEGDLQKILDALHPAEASAQKQDD